MREEAATIDDAPADTGTSVDVAARRRKVSAAASAVHAAHAMHAANSEAMHHAHAAVATTPTTTTAAPRLAPRQVLLLRFSTPIGRFFLLLALIMSYTGLAYAILALVSGAWVENLDTYATVRTMNSLARTALTLAVACAVAAWFAIAVLYWLPRSVSRHILLVRTKHLIMLLHVLELFLLQVVLSVDSDRLESSTAGDHAGSSNANANANATSGDAADAASGVYILGTARIFSEGAFYYSGLAAACFFVQEAYEESMRVDARTRMNRRYWRRVWRHTAHRALRRARGDSRAEQMMQQRVSAAAAATPSTTTASTVSTSGALHLVLSPPPQPTSNALALAPPAPPNTFRSRLHALLARPRLFSVSSHHTPTQSPSPQPSLSPLPLTPLASPLPSPPGSPAMTASLPPSRSTSRSPPPSALRDLAHRRTRSPITSVRWCGCGMRQLPQRLPGDRMYALRFVYKDSLWHDQVVLVLAIVFMYSMIVLGGLVFAHLEGWSVRVATDFSVSTLATIGYGNVIPRTLGGRIMVVCYFPVGFVAVSMTAMFLWSELLAVVDVQLNRWAAQLERLYQRRCRRQLHPQSQPHQLDWFGRPDDASASTLTAAAAIALHHRDYPHHHHHYRDARDRATAGVMPATAVSSNLRLSMYDASALCGSMTRSIERVELHREPSVSSSLSWRQRGDDECDREREPELGHNREHEEHDGDHDQNLTTEHDPESTAAQPSLRPTHELGQHVNPHRTRSRSRSHSIAHTPLAVPQTTTTTATTLTPAPPAFKLLLVLGMQLLMILLWGAVYANVEQWTYAESAWFCFVTFTTVGYGDYTPHQPVSSTFFLYFVMMGLGMFGYFTSVLNDALRAALVASMPATATTATTTANAVGRKGTDDGDMSHHLPPYLLHAHAENSAGGGDGVHVDETDDRVHVAAAAAAHDVDHDDIVARRTREHLRLLACIRSVCERAERDELELELELERSRNRSRSHSHSPSTIATATFSLTPLHTTDARRTHALTLLRTYLHQLDHLSSSSSSSLLAPPSSSTTHNHV